MAEETASGPVVNIAELTLTRQVKGDFFDASFASIAAPRGARKLGARYVEVPAGKAAWPLHCHHANDELFVILSGDGEFRFGETRRPVGPGDVAVCPAGGPETAHQLIAGPGGPLRYLAISTMNEPEVMEYPDSGKLCIFAGAPPGGDRSARKVDLVVRRDSAVNYWDGEA